MSENAIEKQEVNLRIRLFIPDGGRTDFDFPAGKKLGTAMDLSSDTQIADIVSYVAQAAQATINTLLHELKGVPYPESIEGIPFLQPIAPFEDYPKLQVNPEFGR